MAGAHSLSHPPSPPPSISLPVAAVACCRRSSPAIAPLARRRSPTDNSIDDVWQQMKREDERHSRRNSSSAAAAAAAASTSDAATQSMSFTAMASTDADVAAAVSQCSRWVPCRPWRFRRRGHIIFTSLEDGEGGGALCSCVLFSPQQADRATTAGTTGGWRQNSLGCST